VCVLRHADLLFFIPPLPSALYTLSLHDALPISAIAGMAAAAEFVERDREQEQERERNLRDQLWQEISAQISPVVLNGNTHRRLANTLNISLPALDSETMLMALDLEGVCASSGSACMVGSVVASHVLLAMGLPLALARSAIRF